MARRFPIAISPPWRLLLATLGMPGRQSWVDVDEVRGTLHVKGGIWFDESFPLSQIISVERSTFPWFGGLGVKLGPTLDSASVIGSLDGVVAIRFASPQPMRILLPITRTELRVSIEQPEEFIATVRRVSGPAAPRA